MKKSAYGFYEKRGDYVFRKSAYIQWGESEKSLGSCLLLNPGGAYLIDAQLLEKEGKAEGEITLDPTMKQLVKLIERIYEMKPIEGRLYIYNLFPLQHTKKGEAIRRFSDLVNKKTVSIEETLPSINELRRHPWVLLGWGILSENLTSLNLVKNRWLSHIEEAGVPSFGKLHTNQRDYYHVRPQLAADANELLDELVNLYQENIALKQACIQFTESACFPNIFVPSSYEHLYDLPQGWSISQGNPETIIQGYSHLNVNPTYQLKAYQYYSGGNGNGVIWAIPKNNDFPQPENCETMLNDHFLKPPKPLTALDDYMKAIQGDHTPLSYL